MMFRLLTYNIERGGHGRAGAIAAVIKACAPDLVLLQEATDRANVERIAQATGMAEWRASDTQSLGFLSRQPVAFCEWVRPTISRHAFLEVVPAGERLRVFGVHLSAVHAAWTEQRRLLELRALLRSVADHQHEFHVLAGDFNTVAPGESLDVGQLPMRIRPLVWLSGGRINWRTDPDGAGRRLRRRLPPQASRRARLHVADVEPARAARLRVRAAGRGGTPPGLRRGPRSGRNRCLGPLPRGRRFYDRPAVVNAVSSASTNYNGYASVRPSSPTRSKTTGVRTTKTTKV